MYRHHVSRAVIGGALAVAFSGFVAVESADAAFIIEPNGKASGNFSADNTTVDGVTAGDAILGAPGLTPGVASVFSGEPYTYTYTPAVDGDNTEFAPGATLNGFTNPPLQSSGLEAGGAATYNVFFTHAQSQNQTDQPTDYEVDVGDDGTIDVSRSVDQNVVNLDTGQGIGFWERIGQVEITDPSQPVTVNVDTQEPAFDGSPGFVGARTAGVMFEPVPEPASVALLAAGGGLALLPRRRRA